MPAADHDIVLAITGASGAAYATRLLDVLLAAGRSVQLTISPAGVQILQQELGLSPRLNDFQLHDLLPPRPGETPRKGTATYHHYQDYMSGMASGSQRTAGMVICPCSMGTLGSIAHGLSGNLIHRAASVHLKERRKLIVVPRETPLSSIHLGNMHRLSEAGAVVLPAMPGFYHGAQSVSDLVDFIVARICDQLEVDVELIPRWGDTPPTGGE